MSHQTHILLVRLSSVGDVILATPVARRLRKEHPDARITWLVDAPFVELIEHNPYIDRVVAFDHRGDHSGRRGLRRLAEQIGAIDRMIDLQNKLRTVLLAGLLRPARRQVLIKRKGLQVFRALAGRGEVIGAPHQVVRYLRVLDADLPDLDSCCQGIPKDLRTILRVDERQQRRVKEDLDQRQGEGLLIGLIPGARHGTKRWPVEHLTAVGDECSRRGWNVLVLGGLGDTERVKALSEAMSIPPLSETSRGSLGRLACLMAACDVVVSPDTGPAHMAAALGVATLVIFGPTSPIRWAPVGSHVRVVSLDLDCSPCSNYGASECPEKHHACLVDLTPNRVMETIDQLLADRRQKEGSLVAQGTGTDVV